MSRQPRGIRNHNPGNLRLSSDPWQGLADNQRDREFFQFKNASYGIRALARTLIVYQDKYGLRTVEGIINRWAPPTENITSAYVNFVCMSMGVGATDLLDMHSYSDLRNLTEAIIRHENGKGPLPNTNSWYDDNVIDKGLSIAGVEPKTATVGKIPVTTETVGATTAGGIGLGQLVEVMPHVTEAITKADSHLSSGSVIRVILGVALVAVAVAIAYAQIKEYRDGTS